MTTLTPAGPPRPRPGGVREANAALVLGAIRQEGPLSRAAISRRVSLSMATVSRQVAALAELGLVREVPELTRHGAIGRPRVPVDIDDSSIAACGVHIGVTTTTCGLADLRGGLLCSDRIPTPRSAPEDALATIAERVRALLRCRPERTVVGLGLATGGRVDIAEGLVDHDRLGWRAVPARTLLESATGLPVHLDGHVPAMANAEVLFGPGRAPRSLLYFYAREVVGVAIAVDGRPHRGPGRAGDIAHLPIGGDQRCRCGRTGCLEATVSEEAVTRRAVEAGVIAEPDMRLLGEADDAGDPVASRLLAERAQAIGRAVAMLRDVVDPDAVVLGGQAITDAPDYVDDLLHSFAAHTALPGGELPAITRFGPDVQAVAACTSVLGRLYGHPYALLGTENP
ncbi:putative NBD/HSP70 family sugar kinase [Saccharopolyspora erythraea NRRL 2338]|uniref:Possible transcriptional regulator, ROK family n=2 Tax=Saccharopolyspora erythraea TaxID=1836 RepID=A4FEU1_SACEN|nr:ROK family transcriptional regulator [Saccharopolyspora erythraea]EQD82028.1 ROK family transcriptional regulator [Saccharopolyspora erythraea D]PFG96291.1 putative NBD/HSP70 family sugar kinase [Saccharopolyspora erythraea NRRL 2338]QRK92810.1 ROK family transcriptional regulator [Saccharopolyspora erythraea]CAM02566.1 possible transcriptional regulator, ROK family [Saccharopolyspora erythraea NRRL 2338]